MRGYKAKHVQSRKIVKRTTVKILQRIDILYGRQRLGLSKWIFRFYASHSILFFSNWIMIFREGMVERGCWGIFWDQTHVVVVL